MCIPNHPSFFLTSSERETPFNLQHSPSPSALSYFLPDSSQSPASSVSSDNLAVSSDTPPPFYPGEPSLVYPNFNDSEEKINSRHAKSPRVNIAHPYARLYAKKEGTKRRKIWNHALEKSLFSPHELSTMGAPHRRTIYIASLEAHVDRLHAQMISIGLFPIDSKCLDPFKGLNSKTAKSMVAGLQHDSSHTKLKLLELERSNDYLRRTLNNVPKPFPLVGHPGGSV